MLAALGADRGLAEESAYRRAFALVSADVLDRVPGTWLWIRAVRADGLVRDRRSRPPCAPCGQGRAGASWIAFAGAAQVAQLRRTVTRERDEDRRVVYLITSDRDASPEAMAAWIRSHRETGTGSAGSATSPARKTAP